MMKIKEILFSQKLTLILISVFAFAIGTATFIEQNRDIDTAKMLIYNARWMEILLFLLVINLIGVVFKRKLYRKEKITIFLFHLGFIVMIIGAGITRYIGYEGTMYIREGESSDLIFSNDNYLIINSTGGDIIEDFKIDKKHLSNKPFNFKVDIDNGKSLNIKYKDYIINASEEIIEHRSGGKDMLEIRVASEQGNIDGIVEEGQIKKIGSLTFGFQLEENDEIVNINRINDKLLLMVPDNFFLTDNEGIQTDSLSSDSVYELIPNQIYSGNGYLFMLVNHYKNAQIQIVSGKEDGRNPNVLIAEVNYKNKNYSINVFGGDGYIAAPEDYTFNDLTLKIGFGNKPIKLPFSIRLDDFVLERYPGSNSPSSYESEVVLIDDENHIRENHKIFMNNILDYKGFRFFQSSYDPDEKGTILSVSHDRLGTFITYFSYILLLSGFISTFFNKHSRFNFLRKRLIKSSSISKSIIASILLLTGITVSSYAQPVAMHKPVEKEHAENFGHLIVQTFDGRFQPVHTLAFDVIHKLYKRNSITVEGKGTLTGMQLYLDLIIDSEFWKNQKIIYIKDESLQNILGVNEKYASFYDFFDHKGDYKLADYSENAYMKSKAEQSELDREVMKVNERLNILLMTFNGSMLKLFPEPNSDNHKWLSIEDSAAYKPLKGGIGAINEDLQLKVLSYSTILQLYFQRLIEAVNTGNYTQADRVLAYIKSIQRQVGSSEFLPSEEKINMEVHYNKAQIFVLLKYFYMILSILMIIMAFTVHLRTKKSKILNYFLYFLIGLLAGAFLYHTYGLVLRWYLSGHAPWSNGYEALVFVAGGGLLAGFIFMRYSKITLAATALLAFFIMLTAGFSSYDPQLTNLQPVLKSYWLIIHVAVIVISYGFLGLGFVLGLMNLFLYLFKNSKNAERLDLTIKDLTNINEMNLIIGIVMATIGTFLGAVWANESWGRYWGWDSKETWALIILMVYVFVLHIRLIPALNKSIIFNTASIIAFGSVIMTFFGVNYYFSKGLHSYASGSGSIFPLWAWIVIFGLIILITAASYNQKKFMEKPED